MRNASLVERLGASRENFSIFFVLLNAFLWYYLTLQIIKNISGDQITNVQLAVFYSLGVIIGGIIGLVFLKDRSKLLLTWTLFGAASSSTMLIPGITSSIYGLMCFGWGLTLGFGMPTALAYFSDRVPVEKRGRFAGLVFLSSFALAFVVTAAGDFYGVFFMYLFLCLWRLAGIIPLLIVHPEARNYDSTKRSAEYISVLKNDKRLYLFLIPWFIFNIVDSVEELLLQGFLAKTFSQQYNMLVLVSLVCIGLFAFVGGSLSDLIGRKPMMIFGFAASGISYALISVAPNSFLIWFFYAIVDGSAWGLFYSIFVVTIWGDIASKSAAELYYFVGNLPLFLAAVFRFSLSGYMMTFVVTSAFSIATFLLFIAVLPILFTPESLPEKKMKERELKIYVGQAKKIKEKFA